MPGVAKSIEGSRVDSQSKRLRSSNRSPQPAKNFQGSSQVAGLKGSYEFWIHTSALIRICRHIYPNPIKGKTGKARVRNHEISNFFPLFLSPRSPPITPNGAIFLYSRRCFDNRQNMRLVTLQTSMLNSRTGTIRGGSFLSLLLALGPVRRWRLVSGPPSSPLFRLSLPV